MKAVILAGGLGTRISEETAVKPKPMVEIGGRPIIWHIMKMYSHYGINDFIVCCGYKGLVIKEYFANYALHMNDLMISMPENTVEFTNIKVEPWKIRLVDTGQHTMTGGRLRRVREFIGNETFCFTYGDGLSDVNIKNLIDHHKRCKRLATLTAIQPAGRFGALRFGSDSAVECFEEKPKGDGSWVNGGFFVLEPEVIDRIAGDSVTWEQHPLKSLALDKQLSYFKHTGFWQPMDTLRDKHFLEELWEKETAPWKSW